MLLALPDKIKDGIRQRLPGPGGKADEDNAWPGPLARVHQLPEILVLGQDDAVLSDRKLRHGPIRKARPDVGHRNDIETCCPECADHGEVAALIGKELHELTRRTLVQAA